MLLSDFERIKIVYKVIAKTGMTCADYAKKVKKAWKLFRQLNK